MLKRYARVEATGEGVRQTSTPGLPGFQSLPLRFIEGARSRASHRVLVENEPD